MKKMLLAQIFLGSLFALLANSASADCSVSEARLVADNWFAKRPPSPAAISMPTDVKMGIAKAALESTVVYQIFYSYNLRTAMKPVAGHDQVGVLVLRQNDCSIMTFSEAEVTSR